MIFFTKKAKMKDKKYKKSMWNGTFSWKINEIY